MEQSSWRANSHSASQDNSMEPEGSWTCSQEPATGPYPEPDASSPIFVTFILSFNTTRCGNMTKLQASWLLS
jgi:hypothetical protein